LFPLTIENPWWRIAWGDSWQWECSEKYACSENNFA